LGAQAVTDSYLVAQILPATIAGLIGGALTTVFIPLFVEERYTGGEEKAWEGAGAVLGASMVYLLCALGGAYCVSPYFLRLVAPGFSGERFLLALSMNHIMLPSLFFLGMLGIFTGIVQSYRIFTLPALAGLLYNVCLIAFLVFARKSPVLSLSLGNLLGGLMQFLVLALFLQRLRPGQKIRFSLSHPMLRRVWRLMVPIFLGTGVGYLNLIVDRIFASLLPVGTIAALGFAVRVKEIPTGLFGVAISQSIYPTLSSYVAEKKMEPLRNLFSRSLETLWLFILPATVGLFLLSQETVRFLFERGAFDVRATVVTAQSLSFYLLGLFATASLDVVGRVFYAFQDTQTPVKVGVVGLLLNIVLNAVFVRYLAHRGLALATSLSAILMFLVLLEILRHRMGGIEGKVLLKNLGKILLACGGMGVTVLLLRPLSAHPLGYLGTVGAGAGSYALFVLLLRPRSGERIREAVENRLRRMFQRKRDAFPPGRD
jgi:putative peptidoglycan lipid II flippase